MSDFVVVTGLSGAGRTAVAKNLEDLGWFVIDNLPAEIVSKVADLAKGSGSTNDRVAFAVRAGRDTDTLRESLADLRSNSGLQLIFLDASTEILVRRYESSRRPHPFSPELSLADAIEGERAVLDPIRAEADLVIDTTSLNVHELRDRIGNFFGEVDDRPMRMAVRSFGFKHGVPVDVDLVIDCRFLPNPHWVEELRPLTGLDDPVRGYVLSQDMTPDFIDRLMNLLDLLLPAYTAEGKSYLSIAFGCTGGHHRSVAIAEEVRRLLVERGFDPSVAHRDIAK